MAKLSLKIGAFVFVTSSLFSVAHAQTVIVSAAPDRGVCLSTSTNYAPSQTMIVPGRVELRTTPAQYQWATRQELVTPQKVGHYIAPAVYTQVIETTQVAPATVVRRQLPVAYSTVGYVSIGSSVPYAVGMPYGSPYFVGGYPAWGGVTYGSVGYPYVAMLPQVIQSTSFVDEVIPAQFNTVTKNILVKPAERVEYIIPATYRQVSYQVEVMPARSETVEISPVYETRQVPISTACSTVVTSQATVGVNIAASETRSEIIESPMIAKKNFTIPFIKKNK